MRHQKSGRKFSRDTNARRALFRGLSKNLIEKEQIKTTLPKAKDLRGVVEKLITKAKTDSVANRRLCAAELGSSSADAVKKLFTVLGPRYAKRPGGYTRVLKAGFRYGDAAPMAIIELVDRDENAKKATSSQQPATGKKSEAKTDKAVKEVKPVKKAPAAKVARETGAGAKAAGGAKTAARRRTVAG